MEKISSVYRINKKKTNIKNKKSSHFASILRFNLAVALLFILTFPLVYAGDTTIDVGSTELQNNNEVFLNLRNTETNGRQYALVSAGSAGGIGVGKFSIYDRTSGISRLAIDASGNIGIGTAGPTDKLYVTGAGTFTGGPSLPANPAASQIKVAGGYSSPNAARILFGNSAGTGWKLHIARQPVAGGIPVASDDLLTVVDSGNVGIGTAAPSQKLDVAGYVKGQTGLCISNDCRTSWPSGGGGTVTGSGTTNYIPKWTSGTSLGNSVIFDNGNVGIGTTSPTAKLHVVGDPLFQSTNVYMRDTSNSNRVVLRDDGSPSLHLLPWNGLWSNLCIGCGSGGTITSTNGPGVQVYATDMFINNNLHVQGNEGLVAGGRGRLRVGTAWGYAGLYSDASSTGAGNDLVLGSSSGYVRIGPAFSMQTLRAGVYEGPLANSGASVRATSGNVFSVGWDGNTRLYFDGTLVATIPGFTTTKNFIIDNPADFDKYLIHTTLEGPENGVYYRGTAQLINGSAEIALPDYFEALTAEEERSVLLTPKFNDANEKISLLAASNVKNGKFTAKAVDKNNLNQEFYWEVKAVRKDVPKLFVEPNKDEIKVYGFGPYKYYSLSN